MTRRKSCLQVDQVGEVGIASKGDDAFQLARPRMELELELEPKVLTLTYLHFAVC